MFEAAGEEKQQGRELAMLEGTAALAQFRKTPNPEWNTRALAAFQRAMALADPNSATEWEAWTEAALSAASVLRDLARYAEAESLLRQCLRIRESESGSNPVKVAVVLNDLALLLQATNRMAEAEPLMRTALTIDEKSHGPDHPDVARDVNNLAQLLQDTNRLAEAEPLMRRALTIDEKSYGPDHPSVAIQLTNLAALLQTTNRFAAAEPLMRRVLAIDEKSYGPDHPNVAIGLTNLAALLQTTNRIAEAEPLMARAVRILSRFQRSTGHEHPHQRDAMEKYRALLSRLKLSEPEIATRIRGASDGVGKLSPIVHDLERLLGPAKPVAEVLASLDREYKQQDKAQIYFLKPTEPIAPHLDELLRPNPDALTAQGMAASRGGARGDAVALYDAALKLIADQPAQITAKVRIRMNRAAALRDLGSVAEAHDELQHLLPDLEKLPTNDPALKGRTRYHLASASGDLAIG